MIKRMTRDGHVREELTATQARQGAGPRSMLIVLTVSTILAGLALLGVASYYVW